MEQIILILIAGATGGLIKSLMESNGRVIMPSIEKVRDATGNEVRYVHLGFLMNVLVGAGMAAVVADSIETAIPAGMATAFTAEKIVEMKKARTGN